MTGDASPRLSVVIAAFNAAATIEEQLAALVSQGPRSWEILVCDNGSTDATREIVRTWSGRHPEVRLVDASARRGPAAARNVGVAAGHGDLIAFCDADDVVGAGWADAVEKALTVHAFVAGRFEHERLQARSRLAVSWSPQLDGLTRIPYMPGYVTAGAGNLAVRRTVFDAVGGFDEAALSTEDDDLCLRVQLAGHELTFVPDMVLHVRKRTGLRAIAEQARLYGEGARRLQHRYALLSPSIIESRTAGADSPVEETDSPPAVAEGQPGHRPSRVGRLAARLDPSRLANLVWRLGWQRGWSRARLDDVHQLTWPELGGRERS
jgi:glycosyltransferase involved in cell wall biosynthesis